MEYRRIYPLFAAEGLNNWYFWFLIPIGVVGNTISFVVRNNSILSIGTLQQTKDLHKIIARIILFR